MDTHNRRSDMTVASAKNMAKLLRSDMTSNGTPMTHSQSLEQVARMHGYRDWNTMHAGLSQRSNSLSFSVGDRVQGEYLGQPFTGQLIGVQQAQKPITRVTIRFDTPVDVVTFESFSSLRQRVTGEVGPDGRSLRKTSDGQPHLVMSPARG
jgi:hypothetical protein